MKGIVEGITWIIDTIRMLFDLVITMLESLISAFQILGTMISTTLQTISTMPNWISGFMTITITITIVYFLINRETGKSDK